MIRHWITIGACAASLGLAATKQLSEAEAQEVIRKFSAKETDFLKARENYTYRQSVSLREMDEGGRVTGRFEVVSDIVFDMGGKRTERVVRAPSPTLRQIGISPADEQDLRNVQPFVLNSKDIEKYYVRYMGNEMLDEISCYAFAVKPKKLEAGQRYFSGIVWVDDRDLQIVKTYGRGTGVQKKNNDEAFPKFETFREQIDGKYWFPTYTSARDTLVFESGQQTPIRMTVKYENYKQFKSETTITFGEAADQPKPEAPKPGAPKPPSK